MGQGRPSTRGNNAYQPRTEIGENDIPVTDSTVGRTVDLPDYTVKSQIKRSGMIGKLPRSKTTEATNVVRKEKSNLLTDNPFVPKKKFKMPKLPKIKLSGSGKRTAMRGKIK
jgi:hypothetical protein